MVTYGTKLMTGEKSPPAGPRIRRVAWRQARRLMLSISLIALSPDALLTGSHGQVMWGEARASEGPAYSDSADAFADLAPLADDALEQQRGGFSLGGLDIDVGLSVATTIEGIVQVATNYSLTSEKGLVHLGSEIKNLTQDVTADIQSQAWIAGRDIQEEASLATATTTASVPVVLSISEDSSFDNDVSAGVVPSSPDVVTPVVSGPADTTVAASSSGATRDTPPASASAATSFPATESAAPTLPTMTEIIHQTRGDHVTLLTNRLNNVSINQTVSLNITLENLTRITDAARLENDIALMTRQISLFSLRR